MDAKFSIFRTSLQPSMYNSNNNSNSTSIKNTLNIPFIPLKPPINSSSCDSRNRLENPKDENVLTFRNMPLRQSNSQLAQLINPFLENQRLKEQSHDIFSQKYKSVLKKSNYDGSNIKIRTNKKIKFDKKTQIILTVDKEFYVNNNLKNSIWWSSQELLFIRNIVMTEAARIQRNNPKLNIGQCVKEICKHS